MKQIAFILAVVGTLSILSSSALAYDRHGNRGYYGHHGYDRYHGYYGGYRPVVVAPVPAYPYLNYPSRVVYPVTPSIVYPSVYSMPPAYYYPRPYIQYYGRGLSLGIGY